MSDYAIQILDSPEKFSAYRKRWDGLLSESSANTIFLTWEWVSAWIDSFIGKGRTLFILVLSKKNNIMCIAPWYINTVRYGPFHLRSIEYLGSPEASSDYLDVITKPGKEKEAARQIYDYLTNVIPDRWDSLHFRDIPANSAFHDNFINEFQQDGKYIKVLRGSYCPAVILPETKDQFVASLRPHRRRQYNRHWRKISSQCDIKYEIARDVGTNGMLGEFVSFYEKQWGKTSESHTTFLLNLMRRTRSRKWIEVEYIRHKDGYIAAILHMTYNGTKYSYLTAVDKSFNRQVSAGNILVCLAIQDAIERKLERYDFLRGSEPYKFHWANSGEQLLDISYSHRKFISALQYTTDALKNFGKIILR